MSNLVYTDHKNPRSSDHIMCIGSCTYRSRGCTSSSLWHMLDGGSFTVLLKTRRNIGTLIWIYTERLRKWVTFRRWKLVCGFILYPRLFRSYKLRSIRRCIRSTRSSRFQEFYRRGVVPTKTITETTYESVCGITRGWDCVNGSLSRLVDDRPIHVS